MGYWFGKSSKCTSWRRTPTKIGNNWYTPKGEKIHSSKSYFKAVERNGRYWEGNTGWRKSNKKCNFKDESMANIDEIVDFYDYVIEKEIEEGLFEVDFDNLLNEAEEIEEDLDDYEYLQDLYLQDIFDERGY